MKKTYKLEDLDCANCAAKMEDAIRKLDGVTNASVTIEAADDRFDQILKDVLKTIKKVEPDCRVIL